MKPALVLGLALAANTMATDSELFGFAVPQGKLGELARKYPGMIMYDEAADDELALALASRSSFKSDEEYRKYLFQMRTHMDDAADDELLVQPVKDLSRYRVDAFGKVLKDGIGRPLPPVLARFDEATDDELLAFHDLPKYHQPDFHNLPKDEFGKVIRRPYTRLDEVADDELGVKIIHLPVAETMAYDDDELLVQPVKDLSRYRVDSFGKILKDGIGRPLPPVLARFDEVTDDELWVPDQYGRINQPDKYGRLYQPDQYGRMTGIPPVKKPIKPSHVFFDETADDELRIRPISVLPTAEPVAFDDELSFMPIPPKVFVNRDWVKPARIPTSEALIRDDEADDELAYLGQLINERPFARNFDDDEFRVEKPSHLKAQEMTQMKSELPKMKRKFRPIIDEVPLAQN